MRTLVDIPENQIADLGVLCHKKGLSRAEIIRRAIKSYLKQHKPEKINAFGLWKNNSSENEDGLEYQNNLRNEW